MLADGRPEPIESALLAEKTRGNGILHGFFTREGGISGGLYRGLNVGLGSNDDRADVVANRARVSRWFSLPAEALAGVHQVHSPDVVVVTARNSAERPKADAMATREPGLILGVLTADCGPILFADGRARVVGAAHAGWRGAIGGVIENTLSAMVGLGARHDDIVAVLGPSISRTSYEVGPEFVERFIAADFENTGFFTPSARKDHFMFDLPAYTLKRLERAGIRAEWTGQCTYSDEQRFFSYRRATHRAEPDYGRQISAIAITE